MKNLFEVVKANKKEIITKGIIILGSIGGLLITAAVLNKDNEPEEEIYEDADDTDVIDVSTDVTEE